MFDPDGGRTRYRPRHPCHRSAFHDHWCRAAVVYRRDRRLEPRHLDPSALIVAVIVPGASAFAAAIIPSLRVSRVEPFVALRED